MSEIKPTKGSVDRLGEKIRNEKSSITEQTLQELQNYRTSHKDTLSKVFNILCSLSRQLSKQSIVTYRIKRFESIIGKLFRHPKMQFSRMWDIGGCRCILNSNNEVYKLKQLIETHPQLQIKKEYDYIKEPQEEGYKSLHLFVSLVSDNTVIEVQIRNQIDHNWATLVEITDLLFDAKLKEYGENKDLLRFHFLLSRKSNLSNGEKIEIANIIKKYSYLDKLSEVFSRNYLKVRRTWLEIENKKNHNFFLIETKKDEIPKITSFRTFIEAEQSYFSVYKTNQNANIVLTHLPESTYNQISIAYSNYILTFHSFFGDCYEIFENLIVSSLQKKSYFDFIKYFELYNALVYNHIKNLMSEIIEVVDISQQTSKNSMVKSSRKKKEEWLSDIYKQIDKRKEKTERLKLALNEHIPNSFLGKFIINFMIKRISTKYQNKLSKIES